VYQSLYCYGPLLCGFNVAIKGLKLCLIKLDLTYSKAYTLINTEWDCVVSRYLKQSLFLIDRLST